MNNAAHLTNYLSTMAHITSVLEDIINEMRPGERKLFVKLCAEHAGKFNLKGPQLAPFWKAYLGGHPDVEMVAGRYGGMYKKVKPGEVSYAEPRPEPKAKAAKKAAPAVVSAEVVTAPVEQNHGYVPSTGSGGLMIVPHFYPQFMVADDSAE